MVGIFNSPEFFTLHKTAATISFVITAPYFESQYLLLPPILKRVLALVLNVNRNRHLTFTNQTSDIKKSEIKK